LRTFGNSSGGSVSHIVLNIVFIVAVQGDNLKKNQMAIHVLCMHANDILSRNALVFQRHVLLRVTSFFAFVVKFV
jgi:hypothetical protein